MRYESLPKALSAHFFCFPSPHRLTGDKRPSTHRAALCIAGKNLKPFTLMWVELEIVVQSLTTPPLRQRWVLHLDSLLALGSTSKEVAAQPERPPPLILALYHHIHPHSTSLPAPSSSLLPISPKASKLYVWQKPTNVNACKNLFPYFYAIFSKKAHMY